MKTTSYHDLRGRYHPNQWQYIMEYQQNWTSTCIDLGDNIQIGANYFKGEPRIQLWESTTDDLKQKGVSLTLVQWITLIDISNSIDADITAVIMRQAVDKMYHLGAGVHVCIRSPFCFVDLRTWFRPEHQNFRPSIRSFKMKFLQWHALQGVVSQISKILPEISTTLVCSLDEKHVFFRDGLFQDC